MPRVNQIVGRLIQVAAIASIPGCMSLVPQFIDISAPTFYIGQNAPVGYKSLIKKFERVRAMSQFPGIADHTELGALKAIIKENAFREIKGLPKLPLPKESKLTGGADYCFVRDTFHGGERSVSCYAVAEGKIEVRLFDEYSCSNFPKEGCGVGATADQRFTNDYQEAGDISQELFLDTVREKSALVLIAIAFTSPIWLLLGRWIAKQKANTTSN